MILSTPQRMALQAALLSPAEWDALPKEVWEGHARILKQMLEDPSAWEIGKQDLTMAALEWERLKRGMPGSSPETIAKAEADFWDQCRKLQGIRIAMIQKDIAASRAASPDGMNSWDRVEKFRLEHGHLPGDKTSEKACPTCLRKA